MERCTLGSPDIDSLIGKCSIYLSLFVDDKSKACSCHCRSFLIKPIANMSGSIFDDHDGPIHLDNFSSRRTDNFTPQPIYAVFSTVASKNIMTSAEFNK